MKKLSIALLSVLMMFIFVFSISASADMGPKPTLHIFVENAPADAYYLDLLLEGSGDYHSNLREEEKEYNETMLNVLKNYNESGWHTGIVQGTGAPMWGNIIPSADNTFSFGYFGLPNVGRNYKIIMVFSDGSYAVSDVLTRQIYQEEITIEYSKADNTITVTKRQNKFLMFIKQFLPMMAGTLIIEVLLLLLFRIPIKENIVLVLITNFVTNLGLNLILFFSRISSGSLVSYIWFVLLEIAILIAEMIIYAVFMKSKSKGLSIGYAAAANVLSAIAGFFIMLIPGVFV